MATPATLNNWLDQLSSSLLQKRSTRRDSKKLQDAFRRRVKKHNFGRTNQFEVENRLNGLEEKFQVLSLDNLSDALRQRRIELKHFENQWLPDVIDLFLHLSRDPVSNETLLQLYRVPPRIGTPPPLRWKDLLAESPIDRNDNLWKVPDFRDNDDSGYEDDFPSSIDSSTASPKQNRSQQTERPDILTSRIFSPPEVSTDASAVLDQYQQSNSREISEASFIRESLFLLRGYSTNCFILSKQRYQLNVDTKVRGVSETALNYIANELATIRGYLDAITAWVSQETEESYMAAMKHAAEEIVQDYYRSVDNVQQAMISPRSTITLTLSSVLSEVELLSQKLGFIANFLTTAKGAESTNCLETLYSLVQTSQICANQAEYACLASLLVPALSTYLQVIIDWMQNGSTDSEHLPSFIEASASKSDLSKIWTEWFKIMRTTSKRPPSFLAATCDQILACGKTSAFLNCLRRSPSKDDSRISFNTFLDLSITPEMILPFAESFEQAWQQYVQDRLHDLTTKLKTVLHDRCNFRQTLRFIQQLYLPRDTLLLHEFEVKIFDKIDHCIDSWNDRYQLKDSLEEAFAATEGHSLVNQINIHAAHISPRIMQSERASVRILSSLSFDFVIAWPLANIINLASMTAYRRMALVLMQIRRAKYCLERTGYTSVVSVPLSDDASQTDQTFAQVVAFTLLTFVNSLYDSMMLSCVWPATENMRNQMYQAPTVDSMIQIHHDYITRLECSCLAAPRLKLLRQSLASILDLCIRFSDLVSNPTKIDQDGSDHEASSFISAKSRNKSLRMQQYGSDDDDDDYARRLGDGYSSFIVLDDDTTVVKELRKVKTRYDKQVRVLINGLRGVSKGSPETADLESLADRLSWLNMR